MPYIELLGRGDKLGVNITTFISQIIFAHKNKYKIKYDKNFIKSGDNVRFVEFNQKYTDSIFIKTLFEYIDMYNIDKSDDGIEIKIFTIDYFEMISKTVLEVNLDLVSYFKKHMYNDIIKIFNNIAEIKKYDLPFNPETTIAVHLRLDDVRGNIDYDGKLCAREFTECLNSDKIANNDIDILSKNKYGHHFNYQSPIPFDRIESYLSEIKKNNLDSNIIVITSPNENTTQIPYPVFSSYDESYDLFLLCKVKKTILSRSTFSLSSLFFSDLNEYYVPLWGHVPCFGLHTKFDNTSNINYIF